MIENRPIPYRAPIRHPARPIAASTTVEGVARFRWPSERARVPTRCQREHCRGSLQADPPTADHPLTDVVCLLCSRVACELIADNVTLRPVTAAEFAALPSQKKRGPAPMYASLAQRQWAYRERVKAREGKS